NGIYFTQKRHTFPPTCAALFHRRLHEDNISPFCSSVGDIIAYTATPEKQADEPQIWTISCNGTLPTQLREGQAPKISPDGNKILFLRKHKINGMTQIWIMDIDGNSETQITHNSDYMISQANWSPDGKWIVYSANEGLNSKQLQNHDIWLISSEGLSKTQLTTNGSEDYWPCWDYEGKYIYFRSNRGGKWDIWRFEPVIEQQKEN
ncbi:MAG: PD40 domain-containing protein, partial [Phycisphaerae bacterium]|nr:PD40 domain-containing protein [Phycisphaerae bacterium]